MGYRMKACPRGPWGALGGARALVYDVESPIARLMAWQATTRETKRRGLKRRGLGAELVSTC